jgi:hypothetical protein
MRPKITVTILITLFNLMSASMLGRDAIIISKNNTYVDSAISPLVNSFIFEATRRNRQVDLRYLAVQLGYDSNEDPEVIGSCRKIGDIKLVKVNPKYWETSTDSQREALVFHELAHCLLNREHCNEKYSDGRYVSLMSEYSGKDSDYTENREKYVGELFSKHERCK